MLYVGDNKEEYFMRKTVFNQIENEFFLYCIRFINRLDFF